MTIKTNFYATSARIIVLLISSSYLTFRSCLLHQGLRNNKAELLFKYGVVDFLLHECNKINKSLEPVNVAEKKNNCSLSSRMTQINNAL